MKGVVMKKKVISILMAGIIAASLAACGSGGSAAPAAEKTEKTEAAGGEAVEEAGGEGEGAVLNIQCWNDEFARRMRDHMPGYEAFDKDDATKGGKLGDVEVRFAVTPSTDNAYQNNLDALLPANADAAADEKVDMFLVEADYALKYVNTPVALPIADLGITEDELANQYKYTKDIVTDADGNLKGLSWQGCPGVLIYNRDIAKEVLGSDDPEEVQKAVADWDTFKKTADQLKEKGYKITSTTNDSYRVFSNNVSSPWVVDGKINVDDSIKAWVDMSKEMVDKGQTGTADLWSEDWSKGFAKDANVFCYFGPAWLINFSMGAVDDGVNEDDGSRTFAGGWAATVGPQGFFWGGTWICAAAGTDNPTAVAEIMRQMTTNEEVLTDIVKMDNDFVNNKPAMEAAATDDSFAFKPLGGQNPLGMFCEGAEKIDLSNISEYDQGCNESFQLAMKEYFEGNASYDDALQAFFKAVVEKYPELSY